MLRVRAQHRLEGTTVILPTWKTILILPVLVILTPTSMFKFLSCSPGGVSLEVCSSAITRYRS